MIVNLNGITPVDYNRARRRSVVGDQNRGSVGRRNPYSSRASEGTVIGDGDSTASSGIRRDTVIDGPEVCNGHTACTRSIGIDAGEVGCGDLTAVVDGDVAGTIAECV